MLWWVSCSLYQLRPTWEKRRFTGLRAPQFGLTWIYFIASKHVSTRLTQGTYVWIFLPICVYLITIFNRVLSLEILSWTIFCMKIFQWKREPYYCKIFRTDLFKTPMTSIRQIYFWKSFDWEIQWKVQREHELSKLNCILFKYYFFLNLNYYEN